MHIHLYFGRATRVILLHNIQHISTEGWLSLSPSPLSPLSYDLYQDLKALPAPPIAKEYYETGDLYMFDEFQTNSPLQRRRPRIQSLFDVFLQIREDEREHYLTMEALQSDEDVKSPHRVLSNMKAIPIVMEDYSRQYNSSSSSH